MLWRLWGITKLVSKKTKKYLTEVLENVCNFFIAITLIAVLIMAMYGTFTLTTKILMYLAWN